MPTSALCCYVGVRQQIRFGVFCWRLLPEPGSLKKLVACSQEELYSYVTVADEQLFKGKQTETVEEA